MEDKRGVPRVPFLCEVDCEEVESGARAPNSRVSDISATGLFLDSTVTFPEGSVLILKFTLPSLQMRIQVDVVNSMPAMGMGLRYRDLTPVQKLAIEEIIETGEQT
jgi:hypothetical protein